MPPDSRIEPDAVATLAAEAAAFIDVALSRLPPPERDAFWASVRKCYNTPYNDPKPRPLPRVSLGVPDTEATSSLPEAGLPGLVVAMVALTVPALPVCADPHAL